MIVSSITYCKSGGLPGGVFLSPDGCFVPPLFGCDGGVCRCGGRDVEVPLRRDSGCDGGSAGGVEMFELLSGSVEFESVFEFEFELLSIELEFEFESP